MEIGKWHGERVRNAIRQVKLADDEKRIYADDGCNVQCYHDEETIQKEFREAGLTIVGKPEKILYPWTLTKKFDYGDFGEFIKNHRLDVEKEVWDWFVIAKKAKPRLI